MSHAKSCFCVFCERLRKRVEPTALWEARHKDHCNCGDHFTTELLDGAPEAYPAYWLVCHCGAKHLTARETP